MTLHGLAEMTLGVPNVDATKQFYREFGLAESTDGVFASADGGDQLRIVDTPYRRLVEFAVAADDRDDVDRIRRAAVDRLTTKTEASRCSSRSSASAPRSRCARASSRQIRIRGGR